MQRGAVLDYHDPHVPTVTINEHKYNSIHLSSERLQDYDVVVITTDHSDVDYRLIVQNSQLVYDARNATKGLKGKHIYRLGAPEFTG